MFFINLINFSLITRDSSLRNKIILRRSHVLRGRSVNHWKLRSFRCLNTICFHFRHYILHWVITSMVHIENVSIFFNHSIIFVEIRLFRPSVPHVVVVLRLRVDLFKVLFPPIYFVNVCFRSSKCRCRTIDVILHFLMIVELLLNDHTFMGLYLRCRIWVRYATSSLISIRAILI